MKYPFFRTLYFPSVANGELVPILLPPAGILQHVNIVSSVASFTATLYSRPVTNFSAGLVSCKADPSGSFVRVLTKFPHFFAIGDTVVLTGGSVSGYNTTQKVTACDSRSFITDLAYSADGTGGSASVVINVDKIVTNTYAGCRVSTYQPHFFRIGDQVDIAGSSTSGYNTSHVVTSIVDGNTFDTSIAWSANATGGTATLGTASNNKALYELLPQITGTSNIGRGESSVHRPYQLDQSWTSTNTTTRLARAFLEISAAGNYWVTVAGFSN